jgi:hypothetical protein
VDGRGRKWTVVMTAAPDVSGLWCLARAMIVPPFLIESPVVDRKM